MDRIRELRLESKKSMRQVASELKMPYTTYVNYEKGLREPNSEVLIKIANYYHVTIDYLLGHVNEPFFYLDNDRILADINSYETVNTPIQQEPDRRHNVIKIVGRNGSYEERILTDEQIAALKVLLNQLPDASGDL